MKALWIFFPGDFEASLLQSIASRRYERDVLIPPFWRTESFYVNVRFTKKFEIKKKQNLKISASAGSEIGVLLDSTNVIYGFNGQLTVQPGQHEITITVFNTKQLPTLFVDSPELKSDSSWLVSDNDGTFVNAGTENIFTKSCCPASYHLPRRYVAPIEKTTQNGLVIYDFGREDTIIAKSKSSKPFRIYYGETLYEAQDIEHAETIYDFKKGNQITRFAKGCRYISLKETDDCGLSFLEEYSEHAFKPSFHSEDKTLNDIYGTSLRTLDLNTREFFLDGIKRDRWTWGGDAFQSYLMTYYSFFDTDVVKRTMTALLGKEPYNANVNHIVDYSFFWIIGFYEYYLYTGDKSFMEATYPKAFSFMSFLLGRLNQNGMVEGIDGDWVFVDWSDLNNNGEVCIEQMLFYEALCSMSKIASLLGKNDESRQFSFCSEKVKKMIDGYYDDEKHFYRYTKIDGKYTEEVRKHPNIFAIILDLASEERKEAITRDCLCNPNVMKITTPYMRFYELEALLKMKKFDLVKGEIESYWGSMLSLGATSFWEALDPNEKEPACYSMYDRRYGKSLCHAWGSSPLYLIGRYFIGVQPLEPGYSSFKCEPAFTCLGDFETVLPINGGSFSIKRSGDNVCLFFTKGICHFFAFGKEYVLASGTNHSIDIGKEAKTI